MMMRLTFQVAGRLCDPLFRNKRFMLYDITQQNNFRVSHYFGIINPCNFVLFFILCYFFPNECPCHDDKGKTRTFIRQEGKNILVKHEKRKILHEFYYSKYITNFEALYQVISSSLNHLFLKSEPSWPLVNNEDQRAMIK